MNTKIDDPSGVYFVQPRGNDFHQPDPHECNGLDSAAVVAVGCKGTIRNVDGFSVEGDPRTRAARLRAKAILKADAFDMPVNEWRAAGLARLMAAIKGCDVAN